VQGIPEVQEFLAPSNFKSYDELKERLMRVLSTETPTKMIKKAEEEDLPWAKTESAPKFKTADAPKHMAVDDDDDESLEFFKKLAG